MKWSMKESDVEIRLCKTKKSETGDYKRTRCFRSEQTKREELDA